MKLTTGELMKKADAAAITELGISSTGLMEAAARALCNAAEELARNPRAAVFCGSGNNGGDGIAAARFLMEKGMQVRVFLCGKREKLSPDSLEMQKRLVLAGGKTEDFLPTEDVRDYVMNCGVIIDAIFGFGLSRPVQGLALEAINLINSSPAPVAAADVPSGVDISTGKIMGAAVRADRTVTFSMAKPGLYSDPGGAMCGIVSVADIGIPAQLLDRCRTSVSAVMPGETKLSKRPEISHKGTFGKLLIIGGSEGYTGAPTFCARAAVRSGAGLVWLGVPRDIYAITAVKNDEAMPFAITDAADLLKRAAGCTAAAIGPGMGRSEKAAALCREFIEKCPVPLVIDADGLYALSLDPSILEKRSAPTILTPHNAEFLRLGGCLTGDRVGDAQCFARRFGCILVLKGHRSITAFPDGGAYINTTGNAGMAKGGSGDVLTGIIAAMTAWLGADRGVVTGVYLHGLAGDICRKALGEYSMTPTDMIAALPEATMEMLSDKYDEINAE